MAQQCGIAAFDRAVADVLGTPGRGQFVGGVPRLGHTVGGQQVLDRIRAVRVRRTIRAAVERRKAVGDFLRVDCSLTGSHVGCEHGVCGACTVLVGRDAVRSCLVFAIQAGGTANQPWVLLGGMPNEGATSIAPFGQIDLGTPGFGGLEIIGSGLDAGFFNSTFVCNSSDISGGRVVTDGNTSRG